MGLFLSR